MNLQLMPFTRRILIAVMWIGDLYVHLHLPWCQKTGKDDQTHVDDNIGLVKFSVEIDARYYIINMTDVAWQEGFSGISINVYAWFITALALKATCICCLVSHVSVLYGCDDIVVYYIFVTTYMRVIKFMGTTQSIYYCWSS